MEVPPMQLLAGLHQLPRDAPNNRPGGKKYSQSYKVSLKILNVARGSQVNKINCSLRE